MTVMGRFLASRGAAASRHAPRNTPARCPCLTPYRFSPPEWVISRDAEETGRVLKDARLERLDHLLAQALLVKFLLRGAKLRHGAPVLGLHLVSWYLRPHQACYADAYISHNNTHNGHIGPWMSAWSIANSGSSSGVQMPARHLQFRACKCDCPFCCKKARARPRARHAAPGACRHRCRRNNALLSRETTAVGMHGPC